MNDIKIVAAGNGRSAVYTPYHKDFVSRVKLMQGRWDADERCWTVPDCCLEDVRQAMRDIYGRDDSPVSETVDVTLRFLSEVSEPRNAVCLLGRMIAQAYGRDSGAKTGSGVAFLEGEPKSGGSAKNWDTIVPEGCVVKLYDVPAAAFESGKCQLPKGVEIIQAVSRVDRDALLQEKESLLARLEEIDQLLAEEKEEK